MINQVENSAMWMEFRLHPEFSFSSWVSWQNGLNHWDNFVNGPSKFRKDIRTLPTIPIERSYQIAARKPPSGYKVFVACNPLGFFRSRASSIPWKPYNIWDLMKDVQWSATNICLFISVNIIWFSINKLISNQIGLQTKKRLVGLHCDLRLTSMHLFVPPSSSIFIPLPATLAALTAGWEWIDQTSDQIISDKCMLCWFSFFPTLKHLGWENNFKLYQTNIYLNLESRQIQTVLQLFWVHFCRTTSNFLQAFLHSSEGWDDGFRQKRHFEKNRGFGPFQAWTARSTFLCSCRGKHYTQRLTKDGFIEIVSTTSINMGMGMIIPRILNNNENVMKIR